MSATTKYYFVVVAPANFDPFTKVPVAINAFLTTGTTAADGDFLDHTFAEAKLLVRADSPTYLGATTQDTSESWKAIRGRWRCKDEGCQCRKNSSGHQVQDARSD